MSNSFKSQLLKIYKKNSNVCGIKYGSFNAACFDIAAFITYQSAVKAYTKSNSFVEILVSQDDIGSYIDLPSEWRVMIPTGIIMDIPQDHSVRIYARSGLSTKKGLNLINCVGIIDSDYTDEVFIPLYNNSQEKLRIYNEDRIAQGEMIFNPQISIEFIHERPPMKGNRDGGFGSTGV